MSKCHIELTNIQKGYTEVYAYTDSAGCEGTVEQKDVRIHLDLETGKETTVRRWFAHVHTGHSNWPYGNGFMSVDSDHMLTGYDTRTEAVQAIADYCSQL